MATSGTVAQTVIDTATLVEHSMRRCGIPAALQTPESVEIAQKNLYLLLLNLSNRGLNLWCVEKDLLGLTTGQATYALPEGTVRLLNVIYSTSTRATGTNSIGVGSFTTQLSSSTKVVRYGFKPQSTVTAAFTVEYSDDGVAWTTARTHNSQAWQGDIWYWFDFDPAPTATYYRITSVTSFTLNEFVLVNTVKDLPMTQFNRDDYAQQVNKTYQNSPSTNFYFDKLVSPTITCWPVPNNSYDQLSIWRHRFVQDVGTLTQQIEVPQMWMESIVWQLASRLAYELPNVDTGRRKEVIEASTAFLQEAELGESDNAPIFWTPGIGVYNQ